MSICLLGDKEQCKAAWTAADNPEKKFNAWYRKYNKWKGDRGFALSQICRFAFDNDELKEEE
jgi:hypothetical protein